MHLTIAKKLITGMYKNHHRKIKSPKSETYPLEPALFKSLNQLGDDKKFIGIRNQQMMSHLLQNYGLI